MSNAHMLKLKEYAVNNVSLHHALSGYVLDTRNSWSFLNRLKGNKDSLQFSEEPSSQIKAAHAPHSPVSLVDAANEAARVLYDNKVSLQEGEALVLFQGQEFVGAYMP